MRNDRLIEYYNECVIKQCTYKVADVRVSHRHPNDIKLWMRVEANKQEQVELS